LEDASVNRAADELEERSELEDDMLKDGALLNTSSVELDDRIAANTLREGASKKESIKEEALEDAGSNDAALELSIAKDAVLNNVAMLDTVVVLDAAASEEDEETTLQSPKPF
jgi:hypothetical protein